jgi:hypothetical protein
MTKRLNSIINNNVKVIWFLSRRWLLCTTWTSFPLSNSCVCVCVWSFRVYKANLYNLRIPARVLGWTPLQRRVLGNADGTLQLFPCCITHVIMYLTVILFQSVRLWGFNHVLDCDSVSVCETTRFYLYKSTNTDADRPRCQDNPVTFYCFNLSLICFLKSLLTVSTKRSQYRYVCLLRLYNGMCVC